MVKKALNSLDDRSLTFLTLQSWCEVRKVPLQWLLTYKLLQILTLENAYPFAVVLEGLQTNVM